MADGTFVIMDRNEPLPVQDILNAQGAAAVNNEIPAVHTPASDAVPFETATAFRSAATTATGKNVIVVYRTVGMGGCNGSGADPWTYTGASDDCTAYPSAEAARAAAQASVDVREDAVRYVVVAPQD